MDACTVWVADPNYQTAQCGRTATYSLLNSDERLCQFHRNGAVAILPQSASQFVRIEIQEGKRS